MKVLNEAQRKERQNKRDALRFLAFWMAHADEHMVATEEYQNVYENTMVDAFYDMQSHAEEDSHLNSSVLEITDLTCQQVCSYVWEYGC